MYLRVMILVFAMLFCLSANATELLNLDYKSLKDGSEISFVNGNWTSKVDKKSSNYYVKKTSGDAYNFSEFYSPEGDFLFSTATQYEFIYKGSLIGYSNSDLKFYEFIIMDGLLQQRELMLDEVKSLFPKYKVIKISDFSTSTNALKIKKNSGTLKLILFNDTDRYFYNYGFTTNNAKFCLYNLKGFLNVNKRGMIHFSKFGENTKNTPWYIILVR